MPRARSLLTRAGAHNKDKEISYARMMEAFVFSYTVYEVDEMETHQQVFGLGEYMDVYGLEDYDVLWNKSVDSKCMIAWNSDKGKDHHRVSRHRQRPQPVERFQSLAGAARARVVVTTGWAPSL